MTDRVLEKLLRAAREAEAFATAPVRFHGTWLWGTGIAAAVLALVFLPTRSLQRYTIPPNAVEIEHVRTTAAEAGTRVDVLQPCIDTAAAALVLLRVWDRDCSCLRWKVHEFEDGSRITQVQRGDAFQIPLDVSDTPPVEQHFLLAMARRPADLPSPSEHDNLLACLNGVCPPALPQDAACQNPDVLPCLPDGVTLVQRPFVVD